MGSTVTCSFTVDRELYNAYKSVVVADGQNVKGNLTAFMRAVIEYQTPNVETIAAIQEVEAMKADPALGVAYADVDEMMAELLA